MIRLALAAALSLLTPMPALSAPTDEQRAAVALEMAEDALRRPDRDFYSRDERNALQPASDELKALRRDRGPDWTPETRVGIDEMIKVFRAGIAALEAIEIDGPASVVVQPISQPEPETEPDTMPVPAGVLNPGASPVVDPVTWTGAIASGADDAEEWNGSDHRMDLVSSDLEIGNDGARPQIVGLRFTGVDIPQSATINSAYVQFGVDGTGSDAVSVVIDGIAHDDVPAFTTTDGDLSGRDKTSINARVAWSPPAWTSSGEAGVDQRTPDIAEAVEEIIARPGWTSGNSLGVLITAEADTGTRAAESYDGDSSLAPVLVIEYVADGQGGDAEPPPVGASDFTLAPVAASHRPHYGNGLITVNDVGNVTMKGGFAYAVAFEHFEQVDNLDTIRVSMRANNTGSSGTYAGGDGGTYDVSLEKLNAQGSPDGIAIWSEAWAPALNNGSVTDGSGQFKQTFSPGSDLTIEADTPYAIVFRPTHTDTTNDFLSINGVFWQRRDDEPLDHSRAALSRPRLGLIKEYGPDQWDWGSSSSTAPGVAGARYMPIVQFRGGDLERVGNDMEYGESHTSHPLVTSSTSVRQMITPRPSPGGVATGNLANAYLNIAVGKESGTGALQIELDTGFTAEIDLPAVPSPANIDARDHNHYDWYRVAVPDGTVANGIQRTITFTTTGDAEWRVNAGSQTRFFYDPPWTGRAELDDGSGWIGWDSGTNTNTDKVVIAAFFSGDTVQ